MIVWRKTKSLGPFKGNQTFLRGTFCGQTYPENTEDFLLFFGLEVFKTEKDVG